ncbi:response regulator [Leeuwenhoekiella sp. NPDC079379]|uniref:response regulator n=1 Tax=Leeuwenhoekiella sp. NPDC079379 TaxID=3364122 RepID=UPI0037C7A1F5
MNREIFIIDDDKVICLIHKHVIVNVHNEVPKIFIDAEEALLCISQVSDTISILFYLDINMPQLDGWDFIEKLNSFENSNRFSVILVTSSVDLADKNRAEQYELVKGYIEKPLTKAKLISL